MKRSAGGRGGPAKLACSGAVVMCRLGWVGTHGVDRNEMCSAAGEWQEAIAGVRWYRGGLGPNRVATSGSAE